MEKKILHRKLNCGEEIMHRKLNCGEEILHRKLNCGEEILHRKLNCGEENSAAAPAGIGTRHRLIASLSSTSWRYPEFQLFAAFCKKRRTSGLANATGSYTLQNL